MSEQVQVPLLITRDELAEALKSVRLWVRHGDYESVAWRMKVFHPEDVAEDIFTSVAVRLARSDAS